ncbi:MAG: MFS transporter [Dehalococcoidia bacterium]
MNGTRSPEHRLGSIALASWVLYDFASTLFLAAVLTLVFPLWLTEVEGGNDAHVAYALAGAMLVLLVAVPVLGTLSDMSPRRIPYLIGSTALAASAGMFLGYGGLWASLVVFALAVTAYHVGQTFYHALIVEVSTEATRGYVTGIGVAVGYVGTLAGLGVSIWLLSNGHYDAAFKTLTALFVLAALPLLLLVKEQPRTARSGSLQTKVGRSLKQFGSTLQSTRLKPGLRRFLLARVCFTLAISTAGFFAVLYGTETIGMSVRDVQLVILAGVLAAIPAGPLWGILSDRIGPKPTMTMALWGFVVAFVLAIGIPWFDLPMTIWWLVGIVSGISVAGTASSDRPFMLLFIPKGSEGEYLSLHSLTGRVSLVVGPFIWGFIAVTLGLGQPAAVLSLLLILGVSLAILRSIKEGGSHRKVVLQANPATSLLP